MTEIRYGDLVESPRRITVTTVGTQPGPGGGDNWTLVANMAQNRMPAGAGQFAIIVTGKIGANNVVGSGMSSGRIQVCLGTEAGLRHPAFLVVHPITWPLTATQGIPFQFLLLISTAIPDTLLGSSFNPATTQLCLWARTYTNGDSQTYASEFTIGDLQWQWWDIGAIPAGHWSVDEVATVTGIPTVEPTAFKRLAPTASGGTNETWLHYANVWYSSPAAPLLPAPMFKFGVTPDGTYGAFEVKIGNSGLWGMNRSVVGAGSAIGVGLPQVQQGGFWTHTNVGAGTKAGYSAWVYPDPFGRFDRVERYRHFAVRIDTLTDVLTRQDAGPLPAGVPLTGAWDGTSIIRERPQPLPGILTQPIVMVHQVARFPGGNGWPAYGTYVTEAGNGKTVSFGELSNIWPIAEPLRNEAVSSMTLGRRIFQVASPAMQWRAHLVGDAQAAPEVQQAFDFCFVQFHPVRDPENITTPPGGPLTPIVVVPGRQSPEAASLSAPPFAPNGNPSEHGVDERESIRGGTGYRRTWPVGMKSLRYFSLTWGPLRDVDARAVFDFLRSNPAWRYTPPRSAAVAVLNVNAPQLVATDSAKAYGVAVEVAVLIFTGS